MKINETEFTKEDIKFALLTVANCIISHEIGDFVEATGDRKVIFLRNVTIEGDNFKKILELWSKVEASGGFADLFKDDQKELENCERNIK